MKIKPREILFLENNEIKYSTRRTPVTQTLKANEKQFELQGNSSYWSILIKGKEI